MFCPECRAEYREGFTECADCQVALVAELPPEPPDEEFELVFTTRMEDETILAQSILDGAGIEYVMSGEDLQELFGAGTVGFQVPASMAEQARQLLDSIESDEAVPAEELEEDGLAEEELDWVDEGEEDLAKEDGEADR